MKKFSAYIRLMRLDKPVGTVLLLFPVLWAVWLAAGGIPKMSTLFLFVAGVILMRAAGCVINDIADRHWDGNVERTASRPLAQKELTVQQALILFFVLIGTAFTLLVYLAKPLTIYLSFFALAIAVIYPWLKRVTHWPQLGLGVAFSVGVLMAFSEVENHLSLKAGYVFLTAIIWPLIYDTWYAMVDYEDDVSIGIRSTAVLFYASMFYFLSFFSLLFIGLLVGFHWFFPLNGLYDTALILVLLHTIYALYGLKKHPSRAFYFAMFKQHQWIGLIIFIGIMLGVHGL